MARKRKTTAQRYAYVALIVAGVALLATAVLGLIRGLIALELYPVVDPEPWTRGLVAAGLLTVAALAVYGIMTPDTIRRLLTGRQARYGSNALILALAFVGILVVVNVLAHEYPCPWEDSWNCDLTADQSNSLAPETLQALDALPEEVTAIAFFTTPSASADDLLNRFKASSDGRFDYQFVNPDQDPIAAREAGITGEGKIMLMMGERREIAPFASESELTRSLIRLISPGTRALYFLVGHGEAAIESSGAAGLSIARSTLESKNYTVSPLNLVVAGAIPEDALAVIVAGPQKPVSAGEVALLRRYVEAGGGLVIMQDPVIFTEFEDAPDPLAAYLEDAWGIELENDVIVETLSQNYLQAISFSYAPGHPITSDINPNYVVIMPQARSISLFEPEGSVSQTALILTSDQSWGDANFPLTADTQPVYEDGVDVLGPLYMGVAAEDSETGGRVVVFGNSFFASDEWFDAYGNGNIFVNSVDWAAEEEDLIQITPRQPVQRSFQLPSPGRWLVIWLGSVCFLPGLILVAGISSWVVRRRRG